MCRLLDIQLISIDKLKEAYYNPFLQAMMKKNAKHGGSGSTIMACDQMGRICYAMEFDPVYTDASARRYRETCGGTIKPIRGGKEIPYDLR